MGQLPALEGAGLSGRHLVPQAVSEHDRALRDGPAPSAAAARAPRRPPARVREPVGDVGGDVGVLQAAETHRDRRAVQRSFLGLEQLSHQTGLRPGEDVRGDLAVDAGCGF